MEVADGRYVDVLELEDLGLVGIVLFGPDWSELFAMALITLEPWFQPRGLIHLPMEVTDGRYVGVLGLEGLELVGFIH